MFTIEQFPPKIKAAFGLHRLLAEFKDIILDNLLDGLRPLKQVQHHINLISGASPPNFFHNSMNPRETSLEGKD